MKHTTTTRIGATILAALRCYETHLRFNDPATSRYSDIATNGKTLAPLTGDEVGPLCEILNAGGAIYLPGDQPRERVWFYSAARDGDTTVGIVTVPDREGREYAAQSAARDIATHFGLYNDGKPDDLFADLDGFMLCPIGDVLPDFSHEARHAALAAAAKRAVASHWLSIDFDHNRTPEACEIRSALIDALDMPGTTPPLAPASAPLDLVRQIARMQLTSEAQGVDLENDDAMDGLIRRARAMVPAPGAPSDNLALADALESAASDDIWFDGEERTGEPGDVPSRERIANAQAAMVKAAATLRFATLASAQQLQAAQIVRDLASAVPELSDPDNDEEVSGPDVIEAISPLCQRAAALMAGDLSDALATPAEIERARELHSDDGEVEIDDTAIASRSDEGRYVAAWVWVPDSVFEVRLLVENIEVTASSREEAERFALADLKDPGLAANWIYKPHSAQVSGEYCPDDMPGPDFDLYNYYHSEGEAYSFTGAVTVHVAAVSGEDATRAAIEIAKAGS